MSAASDCDLVIVGGGPSGLSTALFLTHHHPHLRERVLVLERERYPREKICAGAVGARADRLLASIGVRVDVPSVPIWGLSVTNGQRELRARSPSLVPIGRVVRRAELDHALALEARARGVRLLEGARVRSLSVDPRRGALLETSLGRLRARAVVGADGVSSIVRRALGFPKGALMAKAVEVDTPRVSSDAPRDTLSFDLSAKGLPGYGWDFPTLVSGKELWCRGIYEIWAEGVPLRAEDEEDPSARLVSRSLAQGLALPSSSLKRFAERGLSWNEPCALPRALLVGEAAGIDPALGEGIAQAIQYGSIAGPFLGRALETDDLSFASFPEVLRRSRLGLDLRVRGRALPFVYGASRPIVERWVTSSEAIAQAGMSYFAGQRVGRLALLRAGLDLGLALVHASHDLGWAALTSLRSAPSS